MRAVKKLIPVYVLSLAIALGAAFLTSGSVVLLSEAMALPAEAQGPTVVLDPGHGGEDGGAVAPDGVKESAINLEQSLRLRDLLRFLGVSVVMTRESDVSICGPEAVTVSEKKVSDLKNRVRLTKETPNALLLSIHQNMFSESKYKGAQVFYAATQGSRELAERLQAILGAKVDPGNHRKAKVCLTAYLLKNVPCTAVLVECGFLSNPEEARRLQTEAYQKLLAAAIAAGLTEHLANQQ